MVHAIIFDNRQDNLGYQFYEKTAEFPENYLQSISQACKNFSMDATAREPFAIRHTPLLDRYLLSVVIRHYAGSPVQDRAHVSIINFLMNVEDAKAFWAKPFNSKKLAEFAQSCYEQRLETFETNWTEWMNVHTKPQEPSDITPIPLQLLLCPILLPRTTFYMSLDTSPDTPIQNLVNALPYALRSNISFLYGITCAKESKNVSLNFGRASTIQSMQPYYDGGPQTDKVTITYSNVWKYFGNISQGIQTCAVNLEKLIQNYPDLYAFFLHAVKSTEIFRQLGTIEASEETLSKLIHQIPLEDFEQAIRQADYKLDIYHTLISAIKTHPGKDRQQKQKISYLLTQKKDAVYYAALRQSQRMQPNILPPTSAESGKIYGNMPMGTEGVYVQAAYPPAIDDPCQTPGAASQQNTAYTTQENPSHRRRQHSNAPKWPSLVKPVVHLMVLIAALCIAAFTVAGQFNVDTATAQDLVITITAEAGNSMWELLLTFLTGGISCYALSSLIHFFRK